MDNSICKPHRFIPNCQSYSGTTEHTCSTCHLGHVLMNTVQQCLQGNIISKCLKNSGNNTCDQCEEGYFGSLCAPIPASQKCLQVNPSDDTECIKCLPGHYLNSGICSEAEDFELRYCEKLGSHSCQICRAFSVLIGVEQFSICRPRNAHTSIPDYCIRSEQSSSNCFECQSGFVLDNNKCVKSCPPARSSIILRQYDYFSGSLQIKYVNKCVDGADHSNSKCQTFVPDSRSPENLVCAQCKVGSVPGIEFSTLSHHMFMISNGEQVNLDHAITSPGLKCLSDSALDLVDNCELWAEFSSSQKCVKCRYGYKGEITRVSSNSYITKCIKDFECSRSIIPNSVGLNMHIPFQTLYPKSVFSSLLSCHHCNNSSEIPFLYAKNQTSGITLTNFDLTDSPTLESTSATTDDFSHICHNPSTFKFYNSVSSSIIGFPTNCGLGLVDPSETISTSGRSDFLQCLACKQKYRASFTGNYISSCTFITGCEKSWDFGQCSLCSSGFVWGYDLTTSSIDKTQCITFTDR